eukprot:104293-Prymnesium_polylepis.1
MAVPALKDATPPQPSSRIALATQLEVVGSKVVGVVPFSDPTTERNVRGYARLLRSFLERDGLSVAEGAKEEARRRPPRPPRPFLEAPATLRPPDGRAGRRVCPRPPSRPFPLHLTACDLTLARQSPPCHVDAPAP